MEGDILYYKYDFHQRIVVRYERDGECNQCGMCCKYIIKFRCANVGPGKDNPITGWHPGNGDIRLYAYDIVNAIYMNGHWRYFADVTVTDELKPCPDLTADNKCRIHTGKHLLSRAWPLSPEQAAHFKECSYTFREVERWTFAEYFGQDWDRDLHDECAGEARA